MDLDDLKNKSKKIKAPEISINDRRYPAGSLDDLITLMKAEDAKDKKLFRRMIIFFSIFGITYAALSVLIIFFPPDGGHRLFPLSSGLYVLAFLAIVVYISRKRRWLNRIDYSRPVLIFLEESERRYRFFLWRDYFFAIPVWIVLIFCGGIYIFNATDRYFGRAHRPTALIIYAVFILIVFAMGYYFSWKNWKKFKGPIRDEIIRMKAELGADESKLPAGN